MIEYEIRDMTCGSCAARIRRALDEAAPGAKIEFDVPARRVRIGAAAGASVDANRLRGAIEAAGYAAQPVARPSTTAAATGCCCAARRAARVQDTPTASASAAGCCG